MSRAIRIPEVAVSLIRNHGLVAWIEQILALSQDKEELKKWSKLRDTVLNNTKVHYNNEVPILLQPLIEDNNN